MSSEKRKGAVNQQSGSKRHKSAHYSTSDSRISHGNGANAHTGPERADDNTLIKDPLASLEAILKAVTNNAKQAEALLGSAALDHAKGLLTAVSKQPKDATTSLNLFHPTDNTIAVQVPAYYAGTHLRSSTLPTLPPIPEGPLSQAPFHHKSLPGYNRTSTSLNYESLEFLGDAYLETIATRLIFARFPHLPAGRQAQLREHLVKNETLLGFSRAYAFDTRLQSTAQDAPSDATKANKGTSKILADVFEAYVAAIILSDPVDGFKRAEDWMTELWAPILLLHHGPESESALMGDFDPSAKQVLQQRVANQTVRLEYRDDKPPLQAKSQTRFFVALYLTGWGYEGVRLGYGEGISKAEAGTRAAMDAMVSSKDVVEDCERQFNEVKEARRVEKERKLEEKKKLAASDAK